MGGAIQLARETDKSCPDSSDVGASGVHGRPVRAVKTEPISHPSPSRPKLETLGTVYVPPKLKLRRTSVSQGPWESLGLYGFCACSGRLALPPRFVELLSMQFDL